MRGVVLSLKALVMIFLTISISFMSSDLSFVSAEEEEQNVCCEETVSGDTCVYTGESNCVEGTLQASTTCEQTAFCKAGCCISDVGKCSKGVAKSTCEDADYTWQEGSDCAVDTCQKNCCVIAESQCSYTTETNCEVLIQDLEDITLDWREVDSENSCTDICQATDRGCSVTSDSCTWETQAECESSDIDITEGTGFYKDTYCSDFGGCGCIEHDSRACVDEDVYWFDSCGNQEEVAEDCDYTSGTWCGTDDVGEVKCLPTGCTSTFDGKYSLDESDRNPHDSKIGEERQNGESWCLYESPAGGWFDRPGSQHYRSFCYFGEEIIEPCADYREQVCIQYPYTDGYEAGINAMNTTNILLDSSKYSIENLYSNEITESGSACIDNGVYQNLINANVTTVPKGGDFWSGGSALADTCSTGNLACPVTFGKVDRFAKWKCVYNCQCLMQEWADVAAGYCGSRGDCGAKFNIAGDYTDVGFYITSSQSVVGDTKKSGEIKNETFVGYDAGCDAYYTGEPDDKGCVQNCDDEEKFGSEECYFISKQSDGGEYDSTSNPTNDHSEDRKGYLENNYGVYGGMIGFSQVIGEFLEQEYSGLSGLEIASWTVGAAAVAFVIIALYFTLTVGYAGVGAALVGGFVEAGLGLSFFVSGAATSATIPVVGWVVAGVILISALISYWITSGGDSMTVTISSNCQAWQAPAGTEKCELCDTPVSLGGLAFDDENENILTGWECTEYKCKSLGNNCQYISENQGTTRPKCIGMEANDVNHPEIKKYMVDVSDDMNSEGLDDTDGYLITPTDDYAFVADTYLKFNQNVAPYQSVTVGIETDEPSQCKIQEGGEPPTDYFTMAQFFPDSYVDYQHNQTWILTPEEKFTFYIRCWDRARDDGNTHEHNFVVEIGTTEGEDITAPQIEATSVRNGAFVPEGVNETLLTLYVDESAQCKWSRNDAEYSLMENYFACSGNPTDVSAYFENECTGVLDVTEATNYYYFACQDYATTPNVNTENYPFTLLSTVPLLIDYVSPTGTLYYDYTDLIVQTSFGAEDGRALCSYDGIEFYQTNSSLHIQPLENLGAGDYAYDISCHDVAGNYNSSEITFTIDVDVTPPNLVSLYKQENVVYFTLDEDATCEYYFEDFDFGQGTSVTNSFTLTDLHQYYLRCQDVFGNEGDWIIHV